MTYLKKELRPSEVYFAEFGKKAGKLHIYQEYLDYRLTLPIATEHILNEGIKIFNESCNSALDENDSIWKIYGCLLLAAYDFGVRDENSVIDKIHKSNISSKQLCENFKLTRPKKNLKLVSCAPIYVDYFKELFDKISLSCFPKEKQLSPEKLFYGLTISLKRPQTSLIKEYEFLDEEAYNKRFYELSKRDEILENFDTELLPIFIWTSEKLGCTKDESITLAERFFNKKQEFYMNSLNDDLTKGKSSMVLRQGKTHF